MFLYRDLWVFAGRTVILLVLSWGGSVINTTPLIILKQYCLFKTAQNELIGPQGSEKYEPRHEKTYLRGLRPVKTQNGLLIYSC